MIYCVYCGTNNPDAASYCVRCGKSVYRPSDQPSGTSASEVAAPSAVVSPRSDVIVGTAHAQQAAKSYTGPLIFGWLFIGASAILILLSFASLVMQTDVTPSASPSSSKSMGFASAVFQGTIFLATGLAIIQRRKIAVKLVWAVTILAGIGVIFRGLIPLDILIWLVMLGLAKWFSTKTTLLTA